MLYILNCCLLVFIRQLTVNIVVIILSFVSEKTMGMSFGVTNGNLCLKYNLKIVTVAGGWILNLMSCNTFNLRVAGLFLSFFFGFWGGGGGGLQLAIHI